MQRHKLEAKQLRQKIKALEGTKYPPAVSALTSFR